MVKCLHSKANNKTALLPEGLTLSYIDWPKLLSEILIIEESNVLNLTINGLRHELDLDPEMPLLWVIREHVGLTGTKYSCGIAECGSCTVYLNGVPARACVTPVSAAVGKEITTIEGLNSPVGKAVQAAWKELEVVQCGFCQSGQVMSATALLSHNLKPTDAEINAAMQGNLCRCATYVRIRAAIKVAANKLSGGKS
jgi:isoquinoline 1-oxidoreductase subunit alpha